MSRLKRLSGLFSSRKTTFQILSDLHLNHETQYLTFHIPVAAPFLILAGNIGRLIDYDAYLSFLIRRCNLHEKVYLVLGSLEFSGISVRDGFELAARMEKEMGVRGKLVVLNRVKADVPGTNVTLVGCTLWSHIPRTAKQAVLKRVPEFDKRHGIRDWTVEAHNAEHVADLNWLKRELQTGRASVNPEAKSSTASNNFVVISSFAPDLFLSLEPWQVDSLWSTAFGTNLLNDPSWNGVHTWICGATGRTTEFKVNGVQVVTNQRGCVGEEVTGLFKEGTSGKEKVGNFDVTKTIGV